MYIVETNPWQRTQSSQIHQQLMMAQIFVGMETTDADVYPMNSGKHFVNTLEDNICERGAMDKMVSDRGSNEISKQVKDILRMLFI